MPSTLSSPAVPSAAPRIPRVRRGSFALLLVLAGCASAPPPVPSEPASPAPAAVAPSAPVAQVRPYEVPSPQGARNDPYYWLRDDTRRDPDVLAYLKAENDYYAAGTAHTQPLQERLYGEIVGRVKQDDATVPYRKRGYWYYTRYAEGQEYPIYARKPGSLETPEQMLIDGNARAQGHDFYQVGAWEVSPDGEWLAFAEDTVGRRQFTIRFKHLVSGEIQAETLAGASPSLVWADDNRTLFYVENDPDTLLGVRVKKHRLGTPASADTLVYEEPDHSYYMGVGRSSDDRYLLIDLRSTLSTELRYLRADRPDGAFRVFAPRERDHEYSADHLGKTWIVRSNWQAKNFRLMQVSDERVGDKHRWRDLVAANDAVYINDFALFDDYLAIGERSDGLQRIRVQPWRGGRSFHVPADEADYTATLGLNPETGTRKLRYGYTSLTTPNTVYELDMASGARTLLKRDPVLGGFDAAAYASERVWATARDGVKVPVSLVYRKGFARDGRAPLLQVGYGSYGIASDPRFSSTYLSLLDRGFVYAIAHIRGGSEMGYAWYEAGKLLNKKNSFTDFIDVTDHLVAQGYAAPDRVFALGGSAGGLLMGAVVNAAPQKYRGIVAAVPFVDVVTTMLDESIPLTTNEFDEWGNPKDKRYYDYMLSYSPYDNVRAQAYPAMLVTTGLWDSQVQYYEPAKWVAKLRTLKTDGNPLLFKINMEAGHGGKSGRFQQYRETAERYAFILDQLGVHE